MEHRATPRYSIKALQAFVATYERGTMTDAGREIGVPQAAVSRFISDLELTINQVLFERSPRGVIPTWQGEALYPRAAEILAKFYRFADLIEGEVLRPPIKVLSFHRLSSTLVAPAISDIRQQNPEARFKVDLRSRRNLAQGQSSGGHDVMIMTTASTSYDSPDKIGRVPLFVVMHPDHELSRHNKLTITDLEGQGTIQLEHGTLMRHISDQLYALEGLASICGRWAHLGGN